LEHRTSQWWIKCVVEVAFSIRGDEAAPYRMTKPSLGTGTGTEPPFSMQKVAQCAQRRRVPSHERAPVDTVLYAIWYVCSTLCTKWPLRREPIQLLDGRRERTGILHDLAPTALLIIIIIIILS
jgi:hypothetical protein